MPIYEYKCPNGHLFELFQRMSDEPASVCEVCGAGPVERVLHPVAVHYKGSGFYSTDYGKGGTGKRAAAAKESSDSSSSILVVLVVIVLVVLVGRRLRRGREEDEARRGVTLPARFRAPRVTPSRLGSRQGGGSGLCPFLGRGAPTRGRARLMEGLAADDAAGPVRP